MQLRSDNKAIKIPEPETEFYYDTEYTIKVSNQETILHYLKKSTNQVRVTGGYRSVFEVVKRCVKNFQGEEILVFAKKANNSDFIYISEANFSRHEVYFIGEKGKRPQKIKTQSGKFSNTTQAGIRKVQVHSLSYTNGSQILEISDRMLVIRLGKPYFVLSIEKLVNVYLGQTLKGNGFVYEEPLVNTISLPQSNFSMFQHNFFDRSGVSIPNLLRSEDTNSKSISTSDRKIDVSPECEVYEPEANLLWEDGWIKKRTLGFTPPFFNEDSADLDQEIRWQSLHSRGNRYGSKLLDNSASDLSKYEPYSRPQSSSSRKS